MGFSPIGNQNTLSQFYTTGSQMQLSATDKNSYPGTGTVWNDLSGFGRTGTITNGPVFFTANGGGFTFDGTNDFVNILRPAASISTTDLTFSIWAKYPAGALTPFLAFNDWNIPYSWLFSFYDKKLYFKLRNTSDIDIFATPGSGGSLTTNQIFDLNKIYNITCTWERATKTGKIYVNGVLLATEVSVLANVNLRVSGNPFAIARSDGTTYYAGTVYNVFAAYRLFSAAEVLQNYNAAKYLYGFNYDANNLLYYDAGNTASYPGSGTAWTNLATQFTSTSTLTNGPTYSTNNGGTIVFDGTNDYATIASPNSAVFTFNAGDFALEAWIKINGNSATNNDGIRDAQILSCFPVSGGISDSWGLQINGNTTTTGTGISFGCRNAAENFQRPTLNYTFTQGVFYQVGITHLSGVTKFFINGELYAASVNLTNNINNTTRPFNIGGLRYAGYLQYLNGTVGVVRIYKGKGLNAAEVLQNYREFSNRI
jgi:hypothetical protein